VCLAGGGIPSGVTVGGKSLFQVAQHPGGALTVYAGRVQDGATADIVVSCSAVVSCLIGVWTLTGCIHPGATYVATATDTGSLTSQNVSINLPAGGVAIVAQIRVGAVNVAWTNATERIDVAVETVSYSAADHSAAASESGRTITMTMGASTFNSMLAVVWR
jgi:hypothetical protein